MAVKSEKYQKLMVMFISVLLAFFLWLYVMGEKNPIQTKVITDVPVTLTNIDSLSNENLTLATPKEKFLVDLNVTGRAFDISKVSASDIEVDADMSGSVKKGNNHIPIIIKNSLKGIDITTKNGLSYINIKLDTIAEKLVPVVINVKGNVKAGFGYTKPLLRPDKVLVSGPAYSIGRINACVGDISISENYTGINSSITLHPEDKNGNEVNDISISPRIVDATVFIKPSKEVPLKISTYGSVEGNKVIKDIKPQANTIMILGDQKYLDKTNEINTVALDLSHINSSTTMNLALNLPVGISTLNGVDSINVSLTVENKLEKNIELPIVINNMDPNYNYNIAARTAIVTLAGPESIINTINDKSASAYINVNGFAEGSYSLPITISQIDGVEVKNLNPDRIDIEITKK